MPRVQFPLSALSMGLATTAVLGLGASVHVGMPKKPQLDRLAAAWQEGTTKARTKPPENFSAFLAQAAKADPALNPSVDAYRARKPLAGDFGLAYRNVDKRIFEVSLKGKDTEEFGILTHADVVPAVLSEWVLDDGTRLDPFKMQRVGDFLYGRGTIDDKGSFAALSKKYTAHNAKEYKEVPALDADMQMFTEVLVRIGNLKQMQ